MGVKIPPCPECGSDDVQPHSQCARHAVEYYFRCETCRHEGPRVWVRGVYKKDHILRAWAQWVDMCGQEK